MSSDDTPRCEGVFRCGTMQARCRKHATLRRCGKYFCDSCARWSRHAMDTREVQRCPENTNGKPCHNLAGPKPLGWCEEHIAEYQSMLNSLKTERDAIK